eukprot:753285-Hanusia_phi.AAC.7
MEMLNSCSNLTGGRIAQISLILDLVASLVPLDHACPVNTFFWRRRRIRRKDEGSFDDPYGPLALAMVLLISLATTFVRCPSLEKSLLTGLAGKWCCQALRERICQDYILLSLS